MRLARRARPRNVGTLLLLAALVAVWLHAADPSRRTSDDFIDSWVYAGVMAGSALVALRGALSARRERPAWLLVATALGLHAVGDILYASASAGDAYPVPSLADGFWLVGYPLLAVAVVAVGRSTVPRVPLGVAIDAVLGAFTAAALVVAVTVERAAVAARGMPADQYVVTIAYPIADAALLAVALTAVGLAGFRRGSGLWPPVAAFAFWIVADLVYCTPLADVPTLGRAADAAVLSGAVVLAVAAGRRRPAVARAAQPELAAAPLAFAGSALVLLAVAAVVQIGPLAILLADTAIGLALLRLAVALADNARLLRLSRLDATTDALTGLGNRRALVARDPNDLVGLFVMIDLNDFKAINDDHGHAVGDVLLCDVAARLTAAVGEAGDVYRLGGDEFCALVRADAVRPRLLDDLLQATTFVTDGRRLSAALGTVSLPAEAASLDAALQLADQRMYADKRRGASRAPGMRQSA
jgi:diguanylate cyclase (GGDEF)-like protein